MNGVEQLSLLCCFEYSAEQRQKRKGRALVKVSFLFGIGMCIVFYLPLHLRALGFTAAEMGVLNLVVRLVSIIVRPAYAMLADKLGRHKLVCFIVHSNGLVCRR